ncbi:MAG: HEAT repeat domain-containing protein, partial [Vicinamibacteria bacterium]
AQTFGSLKSADPGPSWIGYSVPGAPGHQGCCDDCWDDGGRHAGRCRLEDDHRVSDRKAPAQDTQPTRLEGSGDIRVLWRTERGEVSRIRVFSEGCALDAGGLSVHWLTGVKPAESLALLAPFVEPRPDGGRGTMASAAMAAIALHADAGADAYLERFAASSPSLETRKDAVFWMGVARGRRGFESLRRLARQDPEPRLREHVMFALTQSAESEAVDVLVVAARADASPQVRSQALFWLSQKAGQRAVSAIASAIADDPDTDVKSKAVFALSQLPKDQGVPLLIEQARGSRNREVRKQALFWLGQSGDSRALALFQEILAR